MLNAYLGTARAAGSPPNCPHSLRFSYFEQRTTLRTPLTDFPSPRTDSNSCASPQPIQKRATRTSSGSHSLGSLENNRSVPSLHAVIAQKCGFPAGSTTWRTSTSQSDAGCFTICRQSGPSQKYIYAFSLTETDRTCIMSAPPIAFTRIMNGYFPSPYPEPRFPVSTLGGVSPRNTIAPSDRYPITFPSFPPVRKPAARSVSATAEGRWFWRKKGALQRTLA